MVDEEQFGRQDYELLKRDVQYEGVFKLATYTLRHRLFEGGWSDTFTCEMFERPSASAVLPYDPVLDRVILIEQFRPGSLNDPKSPWLIEIPAGIIEANEEPQGVAFRESGEEAGCDLISLQLIYEYFVSPGGSNEYLYLFCGQVDSKLVNGVHGLKHENEDIRVMNISSEEAFYKMDSGLIKNAPALLSLAWLRLNKNYLRESWV